MEAVEGIRRRACSVALRPSARVLDNLSPLAQCAATPREQPPGAVHATPKGRCGFAAASDKRVACCQGARGRTPHAAQLSRMIVACRGAERVSREQEQTDRTGGQETDAGGDVARPRGHRTRGAARGGAQAAGAKGRGEVAQAGELAAGGDHPRQGQGARRRAAARSREAAAEGRGDAAAG